MKKYCEEVSIMKFAKHTRNLAFILLWAIVCKMSIRSCQKWKGCVGWMEMKGGAD